MNNQPQNPTSPNPSAELRQVQYIEVAETQQDGAEPLSGMRRTAEPCDETWQPAQSKI